MMQPVGLQVSAVDCRHLERSEDSCLGEQTGDSTTDFSGMKVLT